VGSDYEFVKLRIDRAKRIARIVVAGPPTPDAPTLAALHASGATHWALRAFRELDDALLDLRFNHSTVGLILVETEGDIERVRSVDRALHGLRADPLVKEILLHMRRVLRRLDITARSIFALVGPGSCFAGSLLELALAADRVYMKDGDPAAKMALSPLYGGALSTYGGLSRLQARFIGEPGRADELARVSSVLETREAFEKGLVTFAPDEIDWEDEVRLAIEERASLSPDALTGMEANLRFAGPETMETKIFGRLTAWQNWIFIRPNAVGAKGALTAYGSQARPEFDFNRT
jgi:benzoyl-CoA-dihydrodiol lyase